MNLYNTNYDLKNAILFWHEYDEYGYFSNWYQASFIIDDFKYANVEQYIMAQKAKTFHDAKRYSKILSLTDPKAIKDEGRDVKPFDEDVWNKIAYDICLKANRAKFSQNPKLKQLLLDTKDRLLAEASPYDEIWGIGLKRDDALKVGMYHWRGKNLLGKILMEIRTELKNEKSKIDFELGDITKVYGIDAIVNAANASLLGGGGVDGAIHQAAGPLLLAECRTLNGCKCGEAKITKAYNLSVKHVIHTVGPQYQGTSQDEEDLTNCYKSVMDLALIKGIRSLAFPSISTGVYHFPIDKAAAIAIKTVDEYLNEHPEHFDQISWVLYDQKTYDIYLNTYKHYVASKIK